MPTFDLRLSRGPAASPNAPFDLPETEPVELSTVWSGPTNTDDTEFASFLRELADAAIGGEISIQFPPYQPPKISSPGAWNLVGDAAFAEEYPLSWNYLHPDSPNYALKRFQRRLYLERLDPWLSQLPSGTSILDLGAGIGRFSHAWLERDWNVTLCDPNAAALVLALSHLAPLNGRFAIHHLAAENIAPLPDNHFHAVSAMEVFCYLSNPRDGMAEAGGVRPQGGWLFASVESPLGS